MKMKLIYHLNKLLIMIILFKTIIKMLIIQIKNNNLKLIKQMNKQINKTITK